MDKSFFISQSTSLTLVIVISLLFVFLGLYNSKKYRGLNNYLIANRNIGLFSLTTSLTASALGAWILFGPASASTWGGMGAIIGYSLGTAFPMFFLIYLGKKIRKEFPKGSSLIEFTRKKFGKSLFKLILLMTIFYMFIFLCAEVTAVAVLINYISGTELWITALIVLLSTLADFWSRIFSFRIKSTCRFLAIEISHVENKKSSLKESILSNAFEKACKHKSSASFSFSVLLIKNLYNSFQ